MRGRAPRSAAIFAAGVAAIGLRERPAPPSGREFDESVSPFPDESDRDALLAQRDALFEAMKTQLRLSDEQLSAVRTIFAGSRVIGQGNPALSVHPMTPDQCREVRASASIVPGDPLRCGAENMVPVFDPGAGESAGDARVCIDQYEFPDIPCEYPVVHVTAREATLLCEAIGKRICDAHEWEGACAGALHDPDREYAWGHSRFEMEALHNEQREIVWAYGPTKDHSKCATGSFKTPTCPGGGYALCGSNTYPAGSFPACVSAFGVYDQHGNAAEHMNLPLVREELASLGGHGWTEMKGSWFIFASFEAHPDDCRWRAPDWHGSRIMDIASHSNYHLGFRCCKTLTTR
jgi:formylglycine-generating enzyme